MHNLSKITLVLLTTIVLIGLSAAAYFAYVNFSGNNLSQTKENLVSVNGMVVAINENYFTIESNNTKYMVYTDNYSMVTLYATHPKRADLVGGYVDRPEVNAMDALVVGSEVHITGTKDGTGNELLVKNLEIIK